MDKIPKFIVERIKCPIPKDLAVISESTPVISFGDAQKAKVATLGLNPSRREFWDKNGDLLENPDRRLATYRSLACSTLKNSKKSVISKVLEECNNYFKANPYRKWFQKFNPILKACGASYYDGSACHLDLVQWATSPTWGKLKPASIRKKLITADAEFLANQLKCANLSWLLINGSGVCEVLPAVKTLFLVY